METLNLIRFILGTCLISIGVLVFITELIGVYRYKFTLDRMHFAGMGDTMGLLFITVGAILINGYNFTSLKLILVLVFFWFSSPVSSHQISRLVTDTDERLKDHCTVLNEEESKSLTER
ncbi:MAG: monovalent cation/H(+) antiporter subunit G [Lachnospiraceae bacterium]|nr:monovalent cation/H(+) antiporter subunit G [Lachnospiraceae bacterium]